MRAPKWFALQVRGGWEFKLRDLLDEIGFESFLPTRAETVRWTDRTKVNVRPLFTGYLFARFHRFDEAPGVTALPGVIQILGHNEIDSVSDDQIASLRKIVDSPLPVLPLAYVVAGSTVRVKCGKFAGCVGTITRIKGKLHLVVSLPMMGRSVAVELDARDVEAEKKAA